MMTSVDGMRERGEAGARRHHSNDYLCGAVASLVNIAVTFPLNKVMFRQQVHGIRVFKALRQIRKEGSLYIYRGLFPPLMQRTITVSLMFGTYSNYLDGLNQMFPQGQCFYCHHTLAALGAGCTEAILSPFERVQSILQVREFHGKLKNTFHAFRVVAGYGIPELYRGGTAVLLRNGPSNVFFLGFRDPLKRALPTPETEVGETMNAFLSGAGLGAALSTVFFPLNVVKTRMQAQLGGRFLGITETFFMIYNERNSRWRKMFRGVHINYTRSFISWGIINAVYELLKTHWAW